MHVEPTFEAAAARIRGLHSLLSTAFVDHIPDWVQRRAPGLGQQQPPIMRGGSIQVVEYTPTTTRLRIRSDGWNLLVSSDTAWRGWRAYWNGERIPPVIVNGGFVGAFVPPGEGELRLRYYPRPFETGLKTSGATLVGFAVFLVILRRRRSTLPP